MAAIGGAGNKTPGLDGMQATSHHEPAGFVRTDGEMLLIKFPGDSAGTVASFMLMEYC